MTCFFCEPQARIPDGYILPACPYHRLVVDLWRKGRDRARSAGGQEATRTETRETQGRQNSYHAPVDPVHEYFKRSHHDREASNRYKRFMKAFANPNTR